MTAWININRYWCDGGVILEKWLRAYDFKIGDINSDILIMDYDTWENTFLNFNDYSLVVIIGAYNVPNNKMPSNAIFKLIPIDYPIFIEYIIEKLKQKKATV